MDFQKRLMMIYAMAIDADSLDARGEGRPISSGFFKDEEKAEAWFDRLISHKPDKSGCWKLALYNNQDKPYKEEVRI